jgi:hypothetical protein
LVCVSAFSVLRQGRFSQVGIARACVGAEPVSLAYCKSFLHSCLC